jgi:hypothetical protein
MDRRFLMAMFSIVCLMVLRPSALGQTGTVIVKPSVDECSRTKLVISLFRKMPLPDKVLFVLKTSGEQNVKPLVSQELTQQTDGKYHWTGIISFRDYVAELYSSDKKTLLGRYSFNTENSAKRFITDRLYEIIQLRQGDDGGSSQQENQILQVTNVNIFPGATLMQILVITEKGGVVTQYLGPPISNWSSPEKVPVGTYKRVILQFSANGCRLM